MGLIKTLKQLKQNIKNVEKYLTVGTDEEKVEMCGLIKRGTCFVAYSINEEVRFAPSRFLGYVYNELYKHNPSQTDGRKTNIAINEILGGKPVPMVVLERKYLAYCRSLGIQPNNSGAFGVQRKYWTLQLKQELFDNEELSGVFPEGKIIERIHKARERNNQVILIAKENFKRKHGRLFCQACGFDFEKKYGKMGIDIIEGHHTIPVSKMLPGEKTNPKDIAMLCANCHLMVHKSRPWLRMDQLHKILKNGRHN